MTDTSSNSTTPHADAGVDVVPIENTSLGAFYADMNPAEKRTF